MASDTSVMPRTRNEFEGDAISHRGAGVAALLWAIFVAYGSLLPFDYTPQPFALAVENFKHITLFEIVANDRADWMANLLLYIPLAFLCLAALGRPGSHVARLFQAVVVIAGACSFALVIEFAQLFFPPRTVSLNDLIAEWLGVFIGTAIWLRWGQRARALWDDASRGGREAAQALGVAYVIAYLGLALFPFDLLLTPAELYNKNPGQFGWWLAPQSCTRALQCGAQLAAEILFAMPLGLFFVSARAQTSKPPWTVLALVGLLMGAGIELAQMLIASGVSQGISAVAKALGFAAGGVLGSRIFATMPRLRRWRGWHALLVLFALVYIAALAVLLDPMRGQALSWQEAMHRSAEIRLLPFYHYYFTTETRAMASVLLQALLYLPPGILLALGAPSLHGMRGAAIAGATSGLLASGIQVMRLLHPPQRADPTDVLIAIVAGLSGYALTRLLLRSPGQDESIDAAITPVPGRSRSLHQPGSDSRWGMYVLLAIVLGAFLLRFPVAQVALGLGLTACVLLLHRYPQKWLVLLLILLPTLDLAPWSGRYYVDEFDAFAFALFVCGAMLLPKTPHVRWPPWLTLMFGLFVISGFFSLARGMLPWPAESFLSLSGYQSPLNALRVGRALVWACLLLWLLGRTQPEATPERSQFVLGMTVGLVGVGLIVLWERIVFAGPFNFSHEYRVAGSFSAISTAGAQIESYLAAATPFAMLAALRGRSVWMRLLGCVALALMLYAVASTASRSAYAGVALAAVLMTLAWLWSAQGLRRKLVAVLVVPALALLLWVSVAGTFVTQRLADVGRDLAQREVHWALVVSLMDTDWPTRLFGMGIGQYPPTFLWKAPAERRPSTFEFLGTGDETFLRLGSGHAVYVEQFVPVEKFKAYTIRGRVRAQPGAQADVNIAVCDKWILYGLDCVTVTVDVRGSGQWEPFTRRIESGDLGRGPPLFRRPDKLAIYNTGAGIIDVTAVVFEDPQGINILANGDFAHGGDRWYFSADDHFPWNIFNLFVEIFFEQGWVGLTALLGLLGAVVLCLCSRVVRSDLLAAAFLSAIAGFLVPGLFDSLIDDPRMRLLLMLLLCASVLVTDPRWRAVDDYRVHDRSEHSES